MYRHLSNSLSVWYNDFIEPIRDELYPTPSEEVIELEKYLLYQYNRPLLPPTTSSMANSINQKTPVLVIYAFINRPYILDLLPQVSVIWNLLN
jgi:polyhydroxyalkanoate synthase subunit PhaC